MLSCHHLCLATRETDVLFLDLRLVVTVWVLNIFHKTAFAQAGPLFSFNLMESQSSQALGKRSSLGPLEVCLSLCVECVRIYTHTCRAIHLCVQLASSCKTQVYFESIISKQPQGRCQNQVFLFPESIFQMIFRHIKKKSYCYILAKRLFIHFFFYSKTLITSILSQAECSVLGTQE